MKDRASEMRRALQQIEKIVKSQLYPNEQNQHRDQDRPVGDNNEAIVDADTFQPCAVMSLPTAQMRIEAAQVAMKVNPLNAPMRRASNTEATPLEIAMNVNKYWGPTPRRLTVSFMEQSSNAFQSKVLEHMNAWTRTCCVQFIPTNGAGNVRITTAGGEYKSYMGTDITFIPVNQPTMWLGNFSLATPESEYMRVVRHETGHTLGFEHEHMRREIVSRINPAAAYAWFAQTQGWNRSMVDSQVLTPLDAQSIYSTPPDQTSIMCYQFPGNITRDGNPIAGGADINAWDYAFAGKVYPRPGSQTESVWSQSDEDDIWSRGSREDWDDASTD